MTEEIIITAATVTTGEKHDRKQLQNLVENSKQTGIQVENIIGDAAYSENENIEYSSEKEIKLISKLSKTVTHCNRKNEDKFKFNKDAAIYVCKTGIWPFEKQVRQKECGSKIKNIFYFYKITIS